jgi:acyl carrier protein
MSAPLDMLALLNGLSTRIKAKGTRPAANLDERLADTGLDSLDVVLLSVYVCEIFGIPEKIGKTMEPATFADVSAFIATHRTREPGSLAEAFSVVDGT